MLWQTDTVTLQSVVNVNTHGSIKQTWTDTDAISCDVQDISTEYAYKKYGLTEANEMRQIFDHTHGSWIVGNQVSYLGEQWLIKLVNASNDKMGASNHTFIIISKVI